MTYEEISRTIEESTIISGANGGYTAWNENLHIINSQEALNIISITTNVGFGLDPFNINSLEITKDKIYVDTPYGNMTIHRKKQDTITIRSERINNYLECNAEIIKKKDEYRAWNNKLSINNKVAFILMMDEMNLSVIISKEDITALDIDKAELSLSSSYFNMALSK